MIKMFQNEVNKYREMYLEKVNGDKWRGRYHLMAPIGWINDPNGLCYFKGKYHVYYQYSPLNPMGGLKFWGHYTSSDLVSWKEEAIALYPDKEFDRDGVYSGSAFVKGNEIYFFYTGNVKHEGNHDYILSGIEQNVIVVTSKDGINFSEKKVVLRNEDFPGNMSLHVRDPKVWEEDGAYYMVLGARSKDDKGCILIYKSDDLYNWTLASEPVGGQDDMGYMWECPDVVTFNGQKVLLFSPQGIEAQGYQYNNIYQSGYIIGEADKKAKKNGLEYFIEIDRGFDFYAPQSFENHDGRKIMIGWMGVPDAVEHQNPTIENFWQHQLTIPRVLELKEEKIYQTPVKELEGLRKELVEYNDVFINEKVSLKLFNSNTYELEINFECSLEFKISFREDCELSFEEGIFKLTLGKSGYGRDLRAVEIDKVDNLRIFSDNSSLEVFVNGGEEVFTTRIYNEGVDNTLCIQGNGKVSISRWNL